MTTTANELSPIELAMQAVAGIPDADLAVLGRALVTNLEDGGIVAGLYVLFRSQAIAAMRELVDADPNDALKIAALQETVRRHRDTENIIRQTIVSGELAALKIDEADREAIGSLISGSLREADQLMGQDV